MAPRVTALGLATCAALAAMLATAGSASACDSKRAKSATASAPSCAAPAKTATACAVPTAKVAVRPQAPAAIVSLPSAAAPVARSAFPALPMFTQPAPIVSGLMAYIDPETGELTGPIGDLVVPDDVARALAAPLELTPVTLPDGSVMVDLQGTLQDYYVLTIDPLGRRSIRCVQDARLAQKAAAPIVLPIAER